MLFLILPYTGLWRCLRASFMLQLHVPPYGLSTGSRHSFCCCRL